MGAYTTAGTGTDVVGRRIGALLVDWAILTAVAWAIVRGWYLDNQIEQVDCSGPFDYCVGTGELVFDDSKVAELRMRIGINATVSLLNFVILQGLTGATVGKLLFGIRTVEDRTYGRPGIVRCFFRTLLLPVDVLVGWLVSMLPSKTNQRIGDRFAGTRVVGLSWYGVSPDATSLPGRRRGPAGAPPGASPSAMPVPGAPPAGAGIPPSAYQPSRPPGMGAAPGGPPDATNPFSVPAPPPTTDPDRER